MKCIILYLGATVFLFCQTMAGEDIRTVEDAPDSVVIEPVRSIIRCQRVLVEDMRINDTIDITLESFGMQAAGYDLRFGTDSRLINILEVLPGKISDSCGWEYFSANEIRAANKDNYPRTLWRVVALSKITPDTVKPECLSMDGENSLVRLVVSNEHMAVVPDTTAPIFFFWENCSDNSVSDESGISLLVSGKVYDYFGVELAEGRDLLPTRMGVPRQCVKQGAANKPQQVLEFHNGGVEFRLDLGEGDSTGKQ
jgi:hypothetical protein